MTAPPMMSLATAPRSQRLRHTRRAGRDCRVSTDGGPRTGRSGAARRAPRPDRPALDSRERGALRCLLLPNHLTGASMRQPRLAVAVMPLENRREALMGVAEAADRAGYDGFFLPETWSFDVTVLLAEAATRTRHLHLGTGVLPVWSRSAGALAMAAATLCSLSGGRFVLGLGASTPQLVEGLHDVPFAAPVARMRRVITQVRALLGGERVPLAVTTRARPLKLNVPEPPAVPIYLAGLADESVRLAGELADGWVPFLYPRSCLSGGVKLLAEGAARAG